MTSSSKEVERELPMWSSRSCGKVSRRYFFFLSEPHVVNTCSAERLSGWQARLYGGRGVLFSCSAAAAFRVAGCSADPCSSLNSQLPARRSPWIEVLEAHI